MFPPAKPMMRIEIVLPANEMRGWHVQLVTRVRAAGHEVGVRIAPAGKTPRLLDMLLDVEQAVLIRRRSNLLARQAMTAEALAGAPDLCIDLAGGAAPCSAPTLCVASDNGQPLVEFAVQLASGTLPNVQLTLDDQLFDTALPMIDNRFSLCRGLEDVLARTISLLLRAVGRIERGTARAPKVAGVSMPPQSHKGSGALAYHYAFRLLPRLSGEAVRRVGNKTHAHWCVGFRFTDGPGVAGTFDLSGSAWTKIADDGERFYADPFPFLWQGRCYIFVEEYEHAIGKGVISVAEIMPDGTAARPVRVLEEEYHLSYPNVFEAAGEIWMLPEGGASRNLTLYRCTKFPFAWERHQILISGRELADATLLEQDGRWWMFAAGRDGAGSAADMMSVFFSNTLHGPWTAHPANPIVIDRSCARPGGNIVKSAGTFLIPLQDGTHSYGGGLGLAEIKRLTTTEVEFGDPAPIQPAGDWPYPRLHTLNRVGSLEVIDGIVS